MPSTPPLPRFAVIGNPVAHSRSPEIHRRFGEQTGIALHYDRLEAPLDAFGPTMHRFFDEGGRGLNVTVPFKLQAWTMASSSLSERAQRAGAVNTLWMKDERLNGCNTDGVGLVLDLVRLRGPLGGARVLLVGAGGAARGVIEPLLQAGCAHVRVVNRTEARAHELLEPWQTDPAAARLSAGGLDALPPSPAWDIVVNATASSLQGQAPSLPDRIYADGALAYDMMYGAQPTLFMTTALAAGAQQAADGLGMLVGQAAESFRLWHGVLPEVAPVLQALRESIAGAR